MYQLIHFCIKVYLFSFKSKQKMQKIQAFYNHYNHYISISPPKGTFPLDDAYKYYFSCDHGFSNKRNVHLVVVAKVLVISSALANTSINSA